MAIRLGIATTAVLMATTFPVSAAFSTGYAVTIPLTAQAAASAPRRALLPADKAEREKAKAQLNSSAERARSLPDFKKAFDAKDSRTLTALLIREGAPSDVVVTPAGGGGSARRLTITCCSKKSWGPVTISF